MISDTLVIRPVDRLSFPVEKLCTQAGRPADLSPSFPHQTGCFRPPDGRQKRFSPAPPTQIRLRKSPLEASSRKPTRVRPLRTRRRRGAQRPRKPFRLRREKAARRGKRSNEARRSAEVKPNGCLSQHRRNGVFHTCGPVSSTRVENSTELSTSCGKDSPASPMGIFSRIGVSGSGVSRLERDRPPPLVADSLALLSPTSRHQLPPLCPPPPVISRLRPFVFRLRSPPASRHAHAVFVVVSGRRGHDLLAVDLDRVLLSLDDVG